MKVKHANRIYWPLLILAALLAGGVLGSGIGPSASPALAAPYTTGDVFVSDGETQANQVQEFTPTGVPVQILNDTNSTLGTTGSAFDAAGNFYVTDFANQTVSKFDTAGAFVGHFGSGYNADPESILFDKTGNAYVGQADGSHQMLKFDSAGNSVASYSPATESRGTDWIDLASDQCTMHYTSEGHSVKSFNVCANAPNPDFATGLPGANAYAHRILSDGGELVADTDRVVRLDSFGNVVQTYLLGDTGILFALNLDPNGTSFWTAEGVGGQVFKVNIATGFIEQQWTGDAGGVTGLSILGEITQGGSPTCSITVTKLVPGFIAPITPFNFTVTPGPSFGVQSGLSHTVVVPCASSNPSVSASYTVAETPLLPGWAPTTITCGPTAGTMGSPVYTNNSATFRADITGDSVHCTFTNTQTCSVTINKLTNPAWGTGFDFSSAYSGLQGITLNDGGSQSVSGPQYCGPIYNLFETPKPGWVLTNIACSFSPITIGGGGNFSIIGATNHPTSGFEPGDNEVEFDSLTPGTSLQCTFINTREGSITICKETPGITGIGTVGLFDFNKFGGSRPPFTLPNGLCITFDNLNPTASPYVFSEEPLVRGGSTWWSYEIDCSDGTKAYSTNVVNINLKPGEDITCNFLNSIIVGLGAVGGVTELLVDDSNSSAARTEGSGGSIPYATPAARAAAALAVVAAGGWYGRRRWLR